jgi:hypothetical protein
MINFMKTLRSFTLAIIIFLPTVGHAIVTGGVNEDRATFGGVLRFGTIENFSPSRGCSGVLISSTLALTAAHCFERTGETTAKIFMQRRGSTTTQCITWRTPTQADPERRCVNRRINVVRHPSYKGDGDSENDIAVVHIVNNSFRLKEVNNYVPIPKDNFARLYSDHWQHSKWMIMAGFGPVLPSGVGHGEYHESRFARTWSGDFHFFYEMGPNSRTCKGDSGGPALLIAKGDNVSTDAVPVSHPVVVGVLSNRGIPSGGNIWCGERGNRTRWTKISSKVEWISDTALRLTGRACRQAHGTIANVKVWLCFD